MKRGFWFLIALFAGMVVAAFFMGVAAIWSGDDRWAITALMFGGVGLVGAFATATYPGWDW
jgi:hypothetical protein